MLNIFTKKTISKLSSFNSLAMRTFAVHKRFTKEHEWLKYDDETKEATFGITDYAQKELGDIVFIDLPFKGDKFEPGDAIGAVESVKTSAQIYIPVASEIIENNPTIDSNPAIVNEDPYEAGWISKVKVTTDEGLKIMMDEEAYKKYIEELE